MNLRRDRLRVLGIWLAVGLVYLIWVRATGWGIPCPIHTVTGLECPGCGITRMLTALSRGDWASARAANAGLFYLSPFLALFLGRALWLWLTGRSANTPALRAAGVGLAAFLVAWGLFRNLPL